jgi:hypothetical protein
MGRRKTILVMEDACVIVLRVPDFDIEEIEDEEDLDPLYETEPLMVFECANDMTASRLLFDIAQYMNDYLALPDTEFKQCLARRFSN